MKVLKTVQIMQGPGAILKSEEYTQHAFERVVRENCTTLKCLSVRGLKKALDNQVHREQLETLDDAFPNVKKLREHFITQTHIRRPHLFLVLS